MCRPKSFYFCTVGKVGGFYSFILIAVLFALGIGVLIAADGDSSLELPTFVDVTEYSGLNFRNEPSHTSQKYLLESMVGGVAMFDFNQDGFLDLYFVNGAALKDPMPEGKIPDKSDARFWNRLYRNNGDWTFSDVTEDAGVAGDHYGQGVGVGDYDNDGFQDLFVANYGENILYRNRGNATFEDVTKKAGVAGGAWSVGGAFFDYDQDGLLDLVVSRYVKWDFQNNPYCGERKPGYRSYCHPKHFEPISHLLYRNRGDGTFENMTESSGLIDAPGKGLGLALNDYDGDGWTDIFFANDSAPQQLFRNRGDGTFSEEALLAGVAYDEDGKMFAGMGVDFLDYDNDGLPDVFINALAHQKYALFRNIGSLFEYHSGPSGVSSITSLHSGWGTKFFDYDNDGRKDIFVAQGHVMDNIELTQPDVSYLEPLLLMRNTEVGFVDVSANSGADFLVPRAARGAAVGDLDNDGFLDLAINCNAQSAVILRNRGQKNHWLKIDLIGTQNNRDGFGAKIRLLTDATGEQFQFISAAGSYLSANDKRAHFGLGVSSRVRFVEITWPGGKVQRLEDVKANQILTVNEPETTRDEE